MVLLLSFLIYNVLGCQNSLRPFMLDEYQSTKRPALPASLPADTTEQLPRFGGVRLVSQHICEVRWMAFDDGFLTVRSSSMAIICSS